MRPICGRCMNALATASYDIRDLEALPLDATPRLQDVAFRDALKPREEGWDMGVGPIALLLMTLWLAGCATAAQRQAATVATQAREAREVNKRCVADVGDEPQFASIAGHLPLDGSPATLAQKADPSLATPQEAKVILSWRSDFANCRLALNTAVKLCARIMPAPSKPKMPQTPYG